MRKGILTRIYAPMAIIQGLRESGVFVDVIQSAHETMSKDTLLSSVESNNSSKVDNSKIVSSRKIGNIEESQATARRILEITDKVFNDSAIPPLSPPGMDDSQIEIYISTNTQ
ncbi:hypothetical protein SLEP1_g49153 [Rubroshorea leprosula]|nr:hypothetical protein SLEP1_g49153 [Rubroshorea leprosula]